MSEPKQRVFIAKLKLKTLERLGVSKTSASATRFGSRARAALPPGARRR
jgi:hypothetical protein